MMTNDDLHRFFATVDSRNPDAIARWLAPEIRLRMGANDWIAGAANVREAFAATGALYAGVRHEISGIWRGAADGCEVAAVEAMVTYTLQTGEAAQAPCTSTLRFEGDKIADYRIHIDLAPLAAATRARNEESVRRFLRLLEAMDFDAWALLFAEDGVQENPYAPAGFPQEFRGRAEIRRHWSTFPDLYDGMHFPNLRFHPALDPDEVIAEFDGDIRIKGADRKYDNRYCCLFQFRLDGLIQTYREYFDPTVLTSAFDHDGPRMDGLAPRAATTGGPHAA
jgi:hypothetical protein